MIAVRVRGVRGSLREAGCAEADQEGNDVDGNVRGIAQEREAAGDDAAAHFEREDRRARGRGLPRACATGRAWAAISAWVGGPAARGAVI